MSLVRYNRNNYSPVGFRSVLDDFFNDNILKSGENTNSFVPKVDIAETEDEFEISIALPGLQKEDITIDLKEGVLSISGERKFSSNKEEKTYKTVETAYGKFNRAFYLPDHVAEDKISAQHENGVLTLIIPKDKKKTESKTIAIN